MIRKHNTAGSFQKNTAESDAAIRQIFDVIRDVYSRVIEDGGRNAREQDMEYNDRLNRRKDVLQVLVTAMAPYVREIRSEIKAMNMPEAGRSTGDNSIIGM